MLVLMRVLVLVLVLAAGAGVAPSALVVVIVAAVVVVVVELLVLLLLLVLLPAGRRSNLLGARLPSPRPPGPQSAPNVLPGDLPRAPAGRWGQPQRRPWGVAWLQNPVRSAAQRSRLPGLRLRRRRRFL